MTIGPEGGVEPAGDALGYQSAADQQVDAADNRRIMDSRQIDLDFPALVTMPPEARYLTYRVLGACQTDEATGLASE